MSAMDTDADMATGWMNLSRRCFIGGLGALSAASLGGCLVRGPAERRPLVRFGLVTDVHYAIRASDVRPHATAGLRCYCESLRKLREAVAVFNERGLDFAVELGDFKDDSGGREATLAHLDAIERAFAGFSGPRYHVCGNHDFDCLEPAEFFAHLDNACPMGDGYYAYEVNGVTFIALDACYDTALRHYSRNNPWTDANVPPQELDWLARRLGDAPGPVVVFCHQRLDPAGEARHVVRNAEAVRALLERSGKVKTVFTGHQHVGGWCKVGGIAYYSLVGLVCGSGPAENSFAEAAVYEDGSCSVTGWKNAADTWPLK